MVSEQDKYNWLKYADKFVFKSLGEGQGYPIMEAMRFGVQPVINELEEFKFLLGDKPYYYHNNEEFLEMIYKPKKDGLVEQIAKYDNWIDRYKKVKFQYHFQDWGLTLFVTGKSRSTDLAYYHHSFLLKFQTTFATWSLLYSIKIYPTSNIK